MATCGIIDRSPERSERANERIGIATAVIVMGDLFGEGMAGEHAMRDGIAVPDMLHNSPKGRLDRFGDTRQLGHVGAPVRLQFPVQLLADVTDLSGAPFERGPDEVIEPSLVVAVQGGPASRVQPALVHEVAHDSRLSSEYKRIHAQIADALLAQLDTSIETSPEAMARCCAAFDAREAIPELVAPRAILGTANDASSAG